MKRLPIIRHVRYFIAMWRINRRYDFWLSLGTLPVHADRDYAEAAKIWSGEE